MEGNLADMDESCCLRWIKRCLETAHTSSHLTLFVFQMYLRKIMQQINDTINKCFLYVCPAVSH